MYKRYIQLSAPRSTRWRVNYKDGWNVYGGATCLESLIIPGCFAHPPVTTLTDDFRNIENIYLYRGKNNQYVVSEKILQKYRKILKKSCLSKYFVYHKTHPIYVKLPSKTSRSLLILVVNFARYTWDGRLDGKSNKKIIESIIYWYEKGYTADQSLVLGSFLGNDDLFYIPVMLGHVAFLPGTSYYWGLANLLPQILRGAQKQFPIPMTNRYLSSVINEVQHVHFPDKIMTIESLDAFKKMFCYNSGLVKAPLEPSQKLLGALLND